MAKSNNHCAPASGAEATTACVVLQRLLQVAVSRCIGPDNLLRRRQRVPLGARLGEAPALIL